MLFVFLLVAKNRFYEETNELVLTKINIFIGWFATCAWKLQNGEGVNGDLDKQTS